MWVRVLAGLIALSAHATASPCAADLATDWVVSQGELSTGQACGAYVGATNGATIMYSFGQFTSTREATLPYRVTVTWRRIGSDARTLELHLLGAALLIGEDRIGLWIDDPTFEVDGYHRLPGHSTSDVHTLSVIQRRDGLEVSLDGRVVDRWAFRPRIARGPVAVAFKGGRGARARMWFRDFRIENLDQSQASERPK